MRIFISLTAAVLLYLTYGLYLAQFDVAILSEELKPENPRGFLDYRGLTDVGGQDMQKVIESAQAVGLDFLSITELNVFDKPTSLAGYHNNLLVLMDGEYSYLNSRLLNLGATSSRHLQGLGRSQVLFAELLSQEHKDPDIGILLLAHPSNPRYRWTGEYPPGLDGLELINLKDVWQNAWMHSKWSFFWTLLIYPFHEKLALLRLFETPDETLRLFDELSQKRTRIGFAGVGEGLGANNHFRFPTYETLFSLVSDHVLLKSELTGNLRADADKLNAAIRQGQLYICLDLLGNPKGFNAVIHTRDGQVIPMGNSVEYQAGLSMEVTLPQKPKVPFDTIIYKNGERMIISNAQITQYYINSPGIYRVAVRVIPTFPLPDGKKWVPWIYTNNFYVTPATGMRTTKPGKGAS